VQAAVSVKVSVKVKKRSNNSRYLLTIPTKNEKMNAGKQMKKEG